MVENTVIIIMLVVWVLQIVLCVLC